MPGKTPTYQSGHNIVGQTQLLDEGRLGKPVIVYALRLMLGSGLSKFSNYKVLVHNLTLNFFLHIYASCVKLTNVSIQL